METWNILIGVLLTVAGTVLVAPGALSRVGTRIKADLSYVGSSLRSLVKPKRVSEVRFDDVAIGKSHPVSTTRTAVWAVHSGSSLEMRVGGLEHTVIQHAERMDQLASSIDANRIQLTSELQNVQKEDLARHQRLQEKLDEAEDESRRVNAAGVPVLGLGAVIGGAASLIAELPTWMNATVLLVAVGLSVYAVWPSVIDPRKARK